MSEKIVLQYPITIDKNEIAELTMRRPKVKDQLLVDAPGRTDAQKEVELFANLCNIPITAMNEIDFETDYAAMQKAYQGFRKGKPKK